jgi:hypothetical protein
MRILYSILLLSSTLFLLCCKNNNSKTVSIEELLKEKSYEGKNVGSPLDVFISTFLKNHPDINNNDVTFENTRKEFAKEFDERLKLGFLNDMPFSCLGVDRDIITKKISASFSVGATSKDSSYAVNVFLDAPVDEETGSKLKQFKYYKLQGTITRPKDDLDEKYDLGPSHINFDKKYLRSSLKLQECIIISVHRLKLDLKGYTEIPKAK